MPMDTSTHMFGAVHTHVSTHVYTHVSTHVYTHVHAHVHAHLYTQGIGVAIFGMPWTTAIALGFILAAVSPAIVTVGFITLKRAGYGVAKGIPTLVISAGLYVSTWV